VINYTWRAIPETIDTDQKQYEVGYFNENGEWVRRSVGMTILGPQDARRIRGALLERDRTEAEALAYKAMAPAAPRLASRFLQLARWALIGAAAGVAAGMVVAEFIQRYGQ
jgi:hypothetical protein